MSMTVDNARKNMGFFVKKKPVNDVEQPYIALPDPTAWSGAESALDRSANRDSNGLLHRDMVKNGNVPTLKHPTKLEYSNYSEEVVRFIMSLVADDWFTFVCPDPTAEKLVSTDPRLNNRYLREMKAYCGDREWEYVWCPTDDDGTHGEWICNLKMSVIEF